MVERAGEAAKLGFKAHPHMLRHACGFALANAGHDTRATLPLGDLSQLEARRAPRGPRALFAAYDPGWRITPNGTLRPASRSLARRGTARSRLSTIGGGVHHAFPVIIEDVLARSTPNI
jgi:hypothetical protein